MIENNGEIKSNPTKITESGTIFWGLGKDHNIKIMEDAGLPIPETLILGVGFDQEQAQRWLDDKKDKDIIIRVNRKSNQRNSVSFRDPEKEELSLDNLDNLVSLEQGVILHALPFGAINHDCMSGVCQFKAEDNWYYKGWNILSHPDIASLSNRFNLSPWWDIKLNGTEVEKIAKVDGNREPLLESIYYRVGRSLFKEKGIVLSKLEKVEYQGMEWRRVIDFCKRNITQLPEDHALVILEKQLASQGLENMQPNFDDVEILRKLYPKFRKVAKLLNQFLQSGFPLNFGVKFSILEYKDKEKMPICWDIIRGT